MNQEPKTGWAIEIKLLRYRKEREYEEATFHTMQTDYFGGLNYKGAVKLFDILHEQVEARK